MNIQTIYVEKSIADHPRTLRILSQLNSVHSIIECERYQEIFNPKAQNFRIQKQHPALILAHKNGKKVLPTPEGFGIGGQQNYYFSHMLNCLYDCRYCFLQGMYQSAHYVMFVNYEDFMSDITELSQQATAPYFFSGYDCDSLALEPVTHFLREFLPFFRQLTQAKLELRTKSTNVTELLKQPAFPNGIVAFSFTPQEISQAVEHKVPSVAKRLQALQKVAEHGWPIGLRFDPLIDHPEFKMIYKKLITDIFQVISPDCLHSISLGTLRFPEQMHQKIMKLYPQDELLASQLTTQKKLVSYPTALEESMLSWLHELLAPYVDSSLLFQCRA